MSPAVEDAASAPAQQLEDGRRADSVHRHIQAVQVDLECVAGVLAARDWSLSGGDAVEDAAVDAALHVAKSAMKDARFLEAVARAHAENVAFDRWTWEASPVACYV